MVAVVAVAVVEVVRAGSSSSSCSGKLGEWVKYAGGDEGMGQVCCLRLRDINISGLISLHLSL